jgi:hypothetical protein
MARTDRKTTSSSGSPAETGIVDGAAFADAGHDVLQDAALRHMTEHVAGRHGGNPGGSRSIGQSLQAHSVVGPAAQRQGEVGVAGRNGACSVTDASPRSVLLSSMTLIPSNVVGTYKEPGD